MDARITVTTNSNGDYTAIQKGSTGSFTIEQIKKAVEIAKVKGEEIRTKLKELPKTG
jgi:exosome complex component RRP42